MSFQPRGTIAFPEFIGARCYMMPFIQGRPETLPAAFAGYADTVAKFVLDGQAGEVGLIKRQFFRIVGKGVHGREGYFTRNPILDRMGIVH